MLSAAAGVSSNHLVAKLKANWINLSLLALGFVPLVGIFLRLSWDRPIYQFFPLAIFGAGMFAWRVISESSLPLAVGSPWGERLLWGAMGLVFMAACVLWSPWLGYIAFLLGLIAVQWSLGGKTLVKAMIPVGLMLLTFLPPPLGWDQLLTLRLRSVAVDTSSSLLDCLQVVHVRDGNTLQLPGRQLLVAEACSGINSFVLCNAFCLFWLLWQRRTLWWLCLALPATSLFVVLGNIFRITFGTAAFYYWKVDLLDGWPHEMFGLVLLLVYCLVVMSSDVLLAFIFERSTRMPATAGAGVDPAAPAGQERVILGHKWVGPLLALIGLGVAATHVFLGGRHGVAPLAKLSFSSPELKLSLPDHLAGWDRINTGSGDLSLVQVLGVHSIGWRFRREGVSATVSVDYPLDGFHNVRVCYEGQGWHALAEDEMQVPGQKDLHALKLSLAQSFQFAEVWHSVVNNQGEWIDPPKAVRFGETMLPQAGYRIQTIIGGYARVTPAEEEGAESLFLAARRELLPQMVAQLRKGGK
jgi:exosortase